MRSSRARSGVGTVRRTAPIRFNVHHQNTTSPASVVGVMTSSYRVEMIALAMDPRMPRRYTRPICSLSIASESDCPAWFEPATATVASRTTLGQYITTICFY